MEFAMHRARQQVSQVHRDGMFTEICCSLYFQVLK